jgi:hypothetical protein
MRRIPFSIFYAVVGVFLCASGCHKDDYCDGKTLHYFETEDVEGGDIVEKTKECPNYCIEANGAADCVALDTPCPVGYAGACFDNWLYYCTSGTGYPVFSEDCGDFYCVESLKSAAYKDATCTPIKENCLEASNMKCYSDSTGELYLVCDNTIWNYFGRCRSEYRCVEVSVGNMTEAQCALFSDTDA